MTEQVDLFTLLDVPRRVATRAELLAEGRRLRDRGIRVSDENATEAWRLVADLAIAEVAGELETFTVDDVWSKLESWNVPHPSVLGFDARALGARIVSATSAQVIEPHVCSHGFIAYTSSSRPEYHGSPVKVYRRGRGR